MYFFQNIDPLVWFLGAHAFLAGMVMGWLLQRAGNKRIIKENRELKKALDEEIERSLQLGSK